MEDNNRSSLSFENKDERAFIDVQVATAQKYKRDIKKVMDNILYYATEDKNFAESCFYSLKRDGKTIRGASVRFAELVANCYGNLRASAKIIENDGRTITAQGVCWDLQNNIAYSIEVKRSIVDKNGNTYKDDMVVVSSNACCAIALRNAVFKCVPLFITNKAQKEIMNVVMGNENDFKTTRKLAVDYFVKLGVPEKKILDLFERKTVEEFDRDDIFDLRGIANAIKDGDTTLELAFSVAPKGNTAISKATKILSVPIEQGEAEYEKTNIPQLNKVDDKKEVKGVTVPQSLKPNSEFINIHGEKEVVFGDNTDSNSDNNNKTEETVTLNKDIENGIGGVGYTGANVLVLGDNVEEKKKQPVVKDKPSKKQYKVEINSVTDEKGNELSPSLYGNIKKEDLVKSEEKPAIVLVKEVEKEVDKNDKEFTIEPFVSNETVVSTPVITDKEPIREVKKKYKKYTKKKDDKKSNDDLFDQKDN